MEHERRNAFILGAGPFGLVSALEFLKKGYHVEIFEKLDIVGGMCRTWKWNNFLVDTGPHIYHTPDQALAEYWEKEFGDLFVKGNFWCKNVIGDNFDQFWDYPLSWESISNYPIDLKKNIISELEGASEEKKNSAKDYESYIDAQVGSTLRKMFFTEYPEKVWGIPTSKMTSSWAPKRIEFRQKVTPFYHGQWNAVGKYGTGCILERIAEKIISLGGKIHLKKTISGFEFSHNIVHSIQFKSGESVKIAPNDLIISSLPITLLAYFFGHKSNLKFRGIASTYLAVNKNEILPQGIHWLYYGSPKVDFNRITEPKKMSPYVSPADKTYLVVETTYSKGDIFDQLSKDQVIKRIIEQVKLTGLIAKNEVVDAEVNKEDFVYPVQYLGHQEELVKAKAAVSSFKQIHTMGTGGEFHYSDIQILFQKAFDLVNRLSDCKEKGVVTIKQVKRCEPNKTININGRLIGDGYLPYIIAEAGLNHNGSVQLAKELIDRAVETGCDAIKFQTYLPDSRVSKKVKAARYAEKVIGMEESIDEMFSRLAMNFSDQKSIFNYAKEKGIEVFSTPFDFESVDFLEDFGVSVYKIASMDLVNLPLIEYVASKGKPIILSTGMSSLGQVEEAVDIILKTGNPNIILLQCNSSYPAAPTEMNLNVIKTYKKCFNVPAGLSDHTFGLFVSHTALAIGANVIERHFTIDRGMEGPDHILSSEPKEFLKLVEIAKSIPKILGNGVKTIQPNEYDTLNIQRKGLYVSNDLKEGEIITKDHISIKGPGGAILPKYMEMIIGRTARKNIQADHPITWDCI